jgi:hypothetical protein
MSQLDKYYTPEENAFFAKDKEFAADIKKLIAELAAIDADEENDKIPGHGLKARVESLINGTTLATPKTNAERRTENLHARQRKEEARDYLADKIRIAKHAAGERLAKDRKPVTDAAEKLVAEKFIGFYDAYYASWKMKRNLLNDGIGLYGSFNGSSGVDEALGIPVDVNSRWADLFRDFVAAGNISKMPAALRPKS